jgi:hypothetical protein
MGAPSGGVIRTTMSTGAGNNNNNNNNNSNNKNINNNGNGDFYQSNAKPAAINTIYVNTNPSTSGTTSCEVYLSLIQQYIAVFQIDNALFLAERCIADNPNCYEAIYMQALCHYRLHKFKNARAGLNTKQHTILQQQQVQLQQQDYKATTNTVASSSGYNNYSTICSMLYLSAQCSYEMGDYTAAETVLIQSARNIYQQQHNINNTEISMDEWILQSTVRTFLCNFHILPILLVHPI